MKKAAPVPSPAPAAVASADGLWTSLDLERRWQAPGKTAMARDRWVRRRCLALGIRPMEGFGRGAHARFRPATVLKREAMAAGERTAA